MERQTRGASLNGNREKAAENSATLPPLKLAPEWSSLGLSLEMSASSSCSATNTFADARTPRDCGRSMPQRGRG